MTQPLIAILMGSDSDLNVMETTLETLDGFGIAYEVHISSAHRSPARTEKIASEAKERGIEVIIAAAGWAAHLAGVVASGTTLPVIGVPIESSPLQGLDSLLSTVQMPGGVPVATMSLGSQGAKNAAVFAAQILALKYPEINSKLVDYKKELAEGVARKDAALQSKLGK